LHFRGPLHLKQLAVYKLSGSKKRGLLLPPSHIYRHRRHLKRSVELEAVKEPKGDDLADESGEDRSKIIHEALDGVLYTLIDWWFKPGQPPKSTPTSTPVQATASPVARPIPTLSAIPKAGGTTGDFSRIGYYDSASQHLDGLTFLGNHGGDGSGVFDE
jgi:hypothetical protein